MKQNSKNQRIRIFSSIEESNEADAKEMASLSPEEHLRNATMLIRKVYAEQMKKPMEKIIRFK